MISPPWPGSTRHGPTSLRAGPSARRCGGTAELPRAYPHHIEDIGEDDINFLIFFDQPTPGDIGYRATASAFSHEALAAGLGIRERDLPQFPFTPIDPLIVARRNPVNPVP